MDANKKLIRDACKKASDYQAWRNPFGVWFVTLFEEITDEDLDVYEVSFFEFQYDETFPAREKRWVLSQLQLIEEHKRKKADEKEGDHKDA